MLMNVTLAVSMKSIPAEMWYVARNIAAQGRLVISRYRIPTQLNRRGERPVTMNLPLDPGELRMMKLAEMEMIVVRSRAGLITAQLLLQTTAVSLLRRFTQPLTTVNVRLKREMEIYLKLLETKMTLARK
jgi:hypothetical protein